MRRVDVTDLATGVVIVLLGAAVSLYSWTHYELGTFTRMGPGMFPVCLGILLAVFGAMILLPALGRSGDVPQIDVRAAVMTTASVAAFALTVEVLGMVPAVTALCFLAVAADHRGTWRKAAALSVVLSAMAVAIFIYGLDLPIRIVRNPF